MIPPAILAGIRRYAEQGIRPCDCLYAILTGNLYDAFARADPEIFGVEALVDTLLAGNTDDLLAIVKARHRKLIAEAHPDAGGDVERAIVLNRALDEAERELTP